MFTTKTRGNIVHYKIIFIINEEILIPDMSEIKNKLM